jgi:hypothetical protein
MKQYNMEGEKKYSKLILIIVITLIGIGVFLRLYFYVINRSLWFNEAMLALNIVNRSFLDLFKPLDYDQGSPIGFLLLEKVVISLLGNKDYKLRLIPLLAGLISIPLMYLVSKKIVGQVAAIFSLALFTFSPTLIYYSSEVKQYSTDVLVSLVLLFVFTKCLDKKTTVQSLILLGVAGSLGIWASHPSIFVFLGILLTLGLTFILHKDTNHLFWLIGIGTMWGICLGIIYFINLRYLATNNYLLDYWINGFAPFPPWKNFNWFVVILRDILKDPAWLPVSIITVGLLLLGIYSFLIRKWQFMLVLICPFLFTMIASCLHKYPFSGRMILFLIPFLLLLLAEGFRFVGAWCLVVNKPIAILFSTAIVIFFLNGLILNDFNHLQSPKLGEDIKPVMAFIRKNYLSTDLIYLYNGAQPAFDYYAPMNGIEGSKYILGIKSRNEPIKYLDDIEKLSGNQRVWFVFSHVYSGNKGNERDYYLEYLNEIGVKRLEFLSSNASVYLYDLK